MGRPLLYRFDPKEVRDTLRQARARAFSMQAKERELIAELVIIDRNKFFVHFGYKSLSGFCCKFLKISRTQTQRIVTRVRRIRQSTEL